MPPNPGNDMIDVNPTPHKYVHEKKDKAIELFQSTSDIV